MPAELLDWWSRAFNPDFPLDPMKRQDDLKCYYDFYRWLDANRLCGLSANGRIEIRDISGPEQTIIFLISGAQGCGRTSLQNLLLYELKVRSAAPPLIAEFKLAPVLARSQTAIFLGRALANQAKAINPSTAAAMTERINAWKDDIIPGAEPIIDFLFDGLKADIATDLPQTSVIVVLDAIKNTVTRDTAQASAAMLRGLADYVILAITDNDDARFIRSSCIAKGQAVALINAPKVNQETLRAFLVRRLAMPRAPGAGPSELYPFTDEALDELFAPSNLRDAAPINVPIRVAIQKLDTAMKRRNADGSAGQSGAGIISRTEMRSVLGLST